MCSIGLSQFVSVRRVMPRALAISSFERGRSVLFVCIGLGFYCV